MNPTVAEPITVTHDGNKKKEADGTIHIDEEEKDDVETTGVCSASYRNDDFFAESPYFDAFVKKEMRSVDAISDTMKDIGVKTEHFALSGLEMAKATRELALSFKVSEKVKSLGLDNEVVHGLESLGNALDEIATAQEDLSHYLRGFIMADLQTVMENKKSIKDMRDEAHSETTEAEQLFMKYFHGGVNSWGNLELSGGNQIGSRARKKEERNYAINPVVVKATQVARWKHDLIRIRAIQTSAEIKRYQLATEVANATYEHNVEVSTCVKDMLSEMNFYFSKCSNLMTGLLDRAKLTKKKSENHRLKHQNRHWEDREQVLSNTLDLIRQKEMDSEQHLENICNTNQSILDPSNCEFGPSTYEFDPKEEHAQIWDLPPTLASYAGHRRPIAKGVLAEGWLYRKVGSLIYRNSTWSRQWFLARKKGLFNLQGDEDSLKKVKVCDLNICTVREVPAVREDPSTRFCFEIITPSNYSGRLMLRARGPHELKKWLDGIRLGISRQLAAGASEVTKKVSNPKPKQQTSSWTTPLQRIPSTDDATDDAFVAQTDLDSPSGSNYTGGRTFSKWGSRMNSSQKTSSRSIESNNSTGSRRRTARISEIRETILERGVSLFAGDMSKFIEENTDDLGSQATEIMKANPTCADCRQESPDWVSLNLGVLICLECSGVHRSLGVHISKVRSLKLDSLSSRQSNLLLSLGNERVNQFWEKEATEDFEKRKADRDNWIQRKYAQKEFIGTDLNSLEGSPEDLSRNLYEASKRADVIGVAKAIIYGGEVNWENPEEENMTAIEVCGVDAKEEQGEKSVGCCEEFLVQNGAEMNADIVFPSQSERISALSTTSEINSSGHTFWDNIVDFSRAFSD